MINMAVNKVVYSCEKCGKEFGNKKTSLERHQTREKSCVPDTIWNEVVELRLSNNHLRLEIQEVRSAQKNVKIEYLELKLKYTELLREHDKCNHILSNDNIKISTGDHNNKGDYNTTKSLNNRDNIKDNHNVKDSHNSIINNICFKFINNSVLQDEDDDNIEYVRHVISATLNTNMTKTAYLLKLLFLNSSYPENYRIRVVNLPSIKIKIKDGDWVQTSYDEKLGDMFIDYVQSSVGKIYEIVHKYNLGYMKGEQSQYEKFCSDMKNPDYRTQSIKQFLDSVLKYENCFSSHFGEY